MLNLNSHLEIVAVIGDFVGEVGDLRFERGIFCVETFSLAGMIVCGVMLGQTFADFPLQIQDGEIRIFLLKLLDDAEAVLIVFEAAVTFHQSRKNGFAFVAERRVAEVVRERDGFRQIGI